MYGIDGYALEDLTWLLDLWIFFYSFVKYLPDCLYRFVFLWSWNFWIVLPMVFQFSNKQQTRVCVFVCDFFVLFNFALICILCDVYPILFLYVIIYIYIVVMLMASVPSLCMLFMVSGFPSPINISHYPFHCLCVSPFFFFNQTNSQDGLLHSCKNVRCVLWPKLNKTKNDGEREREREYTCVDLCENEKGYICEKKLRKKNKIRNNCSCVGLSVCLLACLPAWF